MTHPLWPLFDLRIRTPRLELRPPDDDDLMGLVHLAASGVHDPDVMPFRTPWTDASSPAFEHGALQFHWRTRASWSPDDWHLPLAVRCDGVLVGQQDVLAHDFARVRTVETGSWLGQAHQGKGIGKEMRVAILHLAFLGLDARRAETGAYEHNAPSLGVTQALGYEPNGDAVFAPRGEPQVEMKFKMDRAGFDRLRRDDIEIVNLDPCLGMFGIDGE